jgi:ribose transport system ATP-binding protein
MKQATDSPEAGRVISYGDSVPAGPRTSSVPAVECFDISKGFGGVPFLRGISARFFPGTVSVLAGENGAGKSTLFNILTGQLVPDGGTVSVFGRRVTRYNPLTAQALGISIIPQELLPIPDVRVYENLLIGREIRDRFGFLRRSQMIQQARKMLASVELNVVRPYLCGA